MPLLETARTGFELLLSIGAGSGLLYLLRWYWWRINAWSEIAAMAVSFVVAIGFFVAGRMGSVFPPNTALLVTVFATTFAWITVTLVTRPESEETLVSFYRLIRPAGPGWGSIAAKAGVGPSPDSISMQLLCWVLGCTFVYATLFGFGSALSYVTKNSSEQARLVKTVVSNSTFDRGSLSPTYIKPFDVFSNGGKTGDWLAALDSNTAPVLRWPELCQNVSKTPAESGGSLRTLENSNNP